MELILLSTVESRFIKPPGEKQVGSNLREVRKIGGKITVLDWGRFELSGVFRNRGFEKTAFYSNVFVQSKPYYPKDRN